MTDILSIFTISLMFSCGLQTYSYFLAVRYLLLLQILQLLLESDGLAKLLGCQEDHDLGKNNCYADPSELIEQIGPSSSLGGDIEMEHRVDASDESDDARPEDLNASADGG